MNMRFYTIVETGERSDVTSLKVLTETEAKMQFLDDVATVGIYPIGRLGALADMNVAFDSMTKVGDSAVWERPGGGKYSIFLVVDMNF